MDATRHYSRLGPRKASNLLSALFLCWTWKIFRDGLRRDFSPKDLRNPTRQDQSQPLGDRLERQWMHEVAATAAQAGKLWKRRSPSLLVALTKVFGVEYARLGALVFVHGVLLCVAQPFLLGLLLDYFARPSTEAGVGTEEAEMKAKDEAYVYAAALALGAALTALIYAHYTLGALRLSMRVRTACCSMLYRKALRLSQSSLGATAAGQVVNLLSNDVSRFERVTIVLHYLWLAPMQAAVAAWLMHREVGLPALLGVAVVLLFLPLQAVMSNLNARYRSKAAHRTDNRIRIIDDIVTGIRAIKMYTWEKPFTHMVNTARKSEIDVLTWASYIRGLYMALFLCTTRTAFFGTMIAMALLHENLTARKVFVLQSYFNVLSSAVCQGFVRAMGEVAEVWVSIGRLQKFMLLPEHSEEDIDRRRSVLNSSSSVLRSFEEFHDTEVIDKQYAVKLDEVSAQWDKGNSRLTLDNVNICIEKGSLATVVGPVGSGKTSLLQAVLGELPAHRGKVVVRGSVSYASQEPWVFAASLRQNILFGLPLERTRYAAVLRACVLDRDFAQLPYGDLTVVGDQGVSLSGGQRARLNLARAIYKDAAIYLLDDPFASLDPNVAQEIFDKCICDFLANKTRLLVTNHFHYVQQPNLTVQMDYGSSFVIRREFGDSHVPHSRVPGFVFESLDEEYSDMQVTPKSFKEEDSALWAAITMEKSSKGRIQGRSVYKEYLCSSSNLCVIFLLFSLFVLTQLLVSATDYFVSLWTTQERKKVHVVFESEFTNITVGFENEYSVNSSSFKESANHENLPIDQELGIIIYSSLIITLFTCALIRSLAFYKVCMKNSTRLHDRMFQSVIQTTVHFFDSNPTGRILNRFSKDTGTMDELLPRAMLNAVQFILQMVGCIILSVMVNYYFAVPVVVLGVLFWFSTRVYLKTTNNVKRVEGITKSPVFTHFHATLKGLPTIRAYGTQAILAEEFDNHQDLHTSAWYTFLATSCAFGLFLDCIVCCFIAIVALGSIFLEGGAPGARGGHPGLALTQSLALCGLLQWGVRQAAEVANHMMSVERVLEYTCLAPEPNLEGPAVDPHWPHAGMVKFVNVFIRYNDTDPPAIRNLNVTISPGQKVGVVGRSGSGKSSLVAALLRTCWQVEGRVLVDGVDTAAVPLRELRRHIAIIPQEPLLFAGTLRQNLDPFCAHTDAQLLRVLDEVELRGVLPEAEGLDTRVEAGGRNLSAGQRQLVCLARAVLSSSKILVMDEATANVDHATDLLIQKTIRHKFRDRTVLAVAHRLETVMDYDKILVVDAGQAVEFDHPYELLQNSEGLLYKMVQDSPTRDTVRHLFDKARQSHERFMKK